MHRIRAIYWLLFLTLLPHAYADDALRDRILTELTQHPEKHFRFQQEKKLAVLTQALVTRGVLHTDQQQRIIWEIQEPYTLRYELTRDEIRETDTQGTRSIKPAQNPIAAALTTALSATFTGHWQEQNALTHIEASGNNTQWTLEITPLAEALKPILKSIVVEGSTHTIHRIHITETNGDSTDIQLSPFTP